MAFMCGIAGRAVYRARVPSSTQADKLIYINKINRPNLEPEKTFTIFSLVVCTKNEPGMLCAYRSTRCASVQPIYTVRRGS